MRAWVAAWSLSHGCCRPPACWVPTPERWATRESSGPWVWPKEMVVHTQAGTRFADARSTAYEPTAASRTYYLPMPADGDLDTTPPCSTSLPPRSLDDTVCRAQTDSSTARRRSVLLEPWASLRTCLSARSLCLGEGLKRE